MFALLAVVVMFALIVALAHVTSIRHDKASLSAGIDPRATHFRQDGIVGAYEHSRLHLRSRH